MCRREHPPGFGRCLRGPSVQPVSAGPAPQADEEHLLLALQRRCWLRLVYVQYAMHCGGAPVQATLPLSAVATPLPSIHPFPSLPLLFPLLPSSIPGRRGPTRTRAEQRGLLFDFCWRHHGHYSPSGQCGGDKGSSAAANTAVTIAVTKRRIHRAQAASCLCTGCRRKAMGLACRGHRYGYVLLRTCASGCNRSRRAARVFGRWTGDHHPPMTVSL